MHFKDKTRVHLFGWGVCIAFFAICGPAFAGSPSVQLQGDVLGYTDESGNIKLLKLPCVGSALLEHERLVFIGCGQAGVVVVGPSEGFGHVVLRQQAFEQSVDGFFVADGTLWARSGKEKAWPLDETLWEGEVLKEDPAVVPEPVVVKEERPEPASRVKDDGVKWIGPSANKSVASGSLAPLSVEGEVVENRGETVVINRGRSHGVVKGTRFELFHAFNVSLGGEKDAVREEHLAVGTVVVVTDNHCEVKLAVNEWVPEGAGARVVNTMPTNGIWARPRIGDVSEVGVMLRPYIGLERFAAGTVSSLDYNYRFEEPVRIRLMIDPMGLGFADNNFLISVAANLIASFDADLYEVGLGLGWTVIHDDPRSFFDQATSGEGGGLNSGLSLAQYARFGAEEGFNITIYNSFVLFEKAFYYGGTSGTMQFPLGTFGRPMWIFFRAGGGVAGYAFGELGLRILALGNGGPGSVFVSPTVGYAGMGGNIEECEDYTGDNEFCYYSDDYFTGPMVGLGAQWRF